MENSKIEWTTHTFNPWMGCTKVSDGCKNCYAETLTKGRMQLSVWGPTADRKPRAESAWLEPIRWDRAAAKAGGERPRVFCASLADVFEGPETCQDEGAYGVILAGRRRLWTTICATPHLDWLLLTKRPENVIRFTPGAWETGFPSNVWIGTSVEDQSSADKRIPELMKIPARVRFLSAEPLLGPVDLFHWDEDECALRGLAVIRSGGMTASTPDAPPEGYDDSAPGIEWVIVGGESGPNARPMNPAWAMSLRDQCEAAGVPFLFKQWGNWVPFGQVGVNTPCPCHTWTENRYPLPDLSVRTDKHAAGRVLDGRTWDEYPAVQP